MLRLSNCTITENESFSDGSAIYYEGDATNTLTVAASTINANVTDTTGDFYGAAIVDASDGDGTIAIGTSIVYDNTTLNERPNSRPLRTHAAPVRTNVVPVGTVSECSSPIMDSGYNLSDKDLDGTTNSCGFKTINNDVLVPIGTESAIGLGPLGAYGGPTLGAPGNTSPTYTERLLKGSPAIDVVPSTSCNDAAGAPLTVDERGPGFPRPYVSLCDIGASEVSYLGGTNCAGAITFFSGGTSFALRTASSPNTLVSYLALYGPAGQVRAAPQVPRVLVDNTLFCTVPDPNAAPPPTTTTITVDAQVVTSTNLAIARFSYVRVLAIRTATTETVTVSAINPDGTTGATLYSLTPAVAPQSFVVSLGIPTLYTFPEEVV